MSTKIENVVSRSSWRDFVWANFAGRTFSIPTPVIVNSATVPRWIGEPWSTRGTCRSGAQSAASFLATNRSVHNSSRS